MSLILDGTNGITSPGGDTTSLDSTFHTVKVGLGGGSVSTNTVVGASALSGGSQTGGFNTVVGYQAGLADTSGNGFTAIGYQSLLNNTTGSDSTAVGYQSLAVNTTGGSNVAIGSRALYNNTTAGSNTAVGYQAGYNNTTGQFNVLLGYQAGYRAAGTGSIGDASVFIGYTAGYSNQGNNNVGIGNGSMNANTTGTFNAAVGQGSLTANTTGANNSAFGSGALYSNTTASSNTAVGYQAGYSNTVGQYSTFIGYQAGYNQAVGVGAGYSTLIGATAGYSLTTGTENTFVGQSHNGTGAGYYVTTGSKNTILGGYSGNQGGLDIRTLSNYIVLSDGDGNPRVYVPNNDELHIGLSNGCLRMPSTGGNIYIASVTSNSQFQISYNSITAGVSLGSGATSWGTFSDIRLKNVTGKYENALADILKIEPIKFTWKDDETNKPCVGVSAQSVENVVPEAMDKTTYKMDGDTEYLQVRYTELIPILIAGIQELKAELDALKAKVGG